LHFHQEIQSITNENIYNFYVLYGKEHPQLILLNILLNILALELGFISEPNFAFPVNIAGPENVAPFKSGQM